MFRHIIGTTFTRLFNALMSLAILWITTHNLGKEGLGTIGLIVLGITLILLVSNYIGGGALVFLSSRHDWRRLMIPSYVWACIVSVAGVFLLRIFKLIPVEFTRDIILLSIVQSFMTINLSLLIGKEKVGLFNGISALQMLITAVVLFFLIYSMELYDVKAYVYALYAGFLAGWILSQTAVFSMMRSTRQPGRQPVLRQIIRYGKFIQTANVLQFLNYRLSFYLIEFFIGRAALGVFYVGVQLSEGVWLVGKSVATVQYARISNTSDQDYAKRITLLLFKFTILISFLITVLLVILPESVYAWIFGDDFAQVRWVILSLATGILATAAALTFSHYFSGIGLPVHNMIGSAIGLVLTLVLGLIFIPKFGIIAAGITASVSYLANMIYLISVFIYRTRPSAMDFMIQKEDFSLLIQEWKKGRLPISGTPD